MKSSSKSNRRTLIKNSALLMGGLFVSGRVFGQTLPTMPPGTPSNPSLPNPNQPTYPSSTNSGLYQRQYSGDMGTRSTTGTYSGFYSTNYATSFYGSGYSGFSSGQYN